MQTLKFGFKYWKKYAPIAIFTKCLSIIALTCDLLLPILLSMLLNYCVLEEDPAKENGIFAWFLDGRYGQVHTMKLFWHLLLWLTVLIVAKHIIVYIRDNINEWIGLLFETDLRNVTFKQLLELDSATIAKYNTGELLTIINSDTIMFKMTFSSVIPNLFDSVYVIIVAVFLLGKINPWLLIIPLLISPFTIVKLMQFRKQSKINFTKIRSENSKMSLAVQENIEAVRLVRSFTNEDAEKEKFNIVNESLQNAYVEQVSLQAKFDALLNSLRQIAYIGSIMVTTILVIKGLLPVGYLVASTEYVNRIIGFTNQFSNMLFQIQQQIVSGIKMYDFLNHKSLIKNGENAIDACSKPNINITNGYLTIDDKSILKNININIPYGKKIGIVGGTGSGKTMLLESLIRAHDLTSGSITLDGTDIKSFDLEDLRKQYSFVFQDIFLFSNTIDSNIAYSEPDISKDAVVDAAKHSMAHGFITQLDNQYDTIIGERGLGISGGQKQRVSIARALLKGAPVLILDDSTSALDVQTERALLKDIKETYPEKTLIISAHRFSSVIDCDEILYMQDGEIIERGTFDELMNLNGHFAKVYNVQKAQTKEIVNYDSIADIHRGANRM